MTPERASELAAEVCALAPVVPVLVVDDAADAAPLAQALIAGGLPALEVTLRTPAALEVIREMAKVEGGTVGAGTLLTSKDVENAKAAGATFGVSPGATDRLLDACERRITLRCPTPFVLAGLGWLRPNWSNPRIGRASLHWPRRPRPYHVKP